MADLRDDLPAAATGARSPGGVSRRVLVGGLAGLTLAACSGQEEPRSEPSAAPASMAPDVAVATSALAQVRAVRQAASSTLTRFPDARATLAPIVALHRTHEAALVEAVPASARTSDSSAPYRVPRRRDRALGALVTREEQLHDGLGALALSAQSGQFARLLAGMGAAVHQRLAQWPEPDGGSA